MQRVRWQDNDGAVAIALVGVLLIALALSLYGSGVYLNDVESCWSIPAAHLDSPTNAAACDMVRLDRMATVRNTAIAGLVVVLLAGFTARWRWLYLDEDRPATWLAVAAALLTPIIPFLALGIAYESGVMLNVGAFGVAAGMLMAWYPAAVLRDVATRAHLLTAAAAAAPLTCVVIATINASRRGASPRPWGLQQADLFDEDGMWTVLVPTAVSALLFTAAVVLAKTGRRAPNLWVGAVLFTISTAVTVAVSVPDLVPAWQSTTNNSLEGPPGPAVWLPMLVAPAVLTALVWAGCALRRTPSATETEPAFS